MICLTNIDALFTVLFTVALLVSVGSLIWALGRRRGRRIVNPPRQVPVSVVYWYLDQRYGVEQQTTIEEKFFVVPRIGEDIPLFCDEAKSRDLPQGRYRVFSGKHERDMLGAWRPEIMARLIQ